MMKCKSRGCYGVFLIPSLTLGVLPCWCPWYDGRVQGTAGETLVMALMAAMRTMATMITVMMFAAKVTKITTWLQAAARGSLARLQYIKLRWESMGINGNQFESMEIKSISTIWIKLNSFNHKIQSQIKANIYNCVLYNCSQFEYINQNPKMP